MTVCGLALDSAEQARMVQDIRTILTASPLVRPRTPNGLDMKVRVSAAGSLGWVGDGGYHYSETDARGNPWPKIPAWWREFADEACAAKYMGQSMPWDCAIINWYDVDASLGWHRDLAERSKDWPIVTFSLGDACSWAWRLDEDSPIQRTRLESGAITVLDGPNRMALHTVERIIPAPMFSPLKVRGRVSVTLRVAGPAGEY